ncbi:Mitochondrial import receptor subunit TOM9-2 [Linum grandiflorum]
MAAQSSRGTVSVPDKRASPSSKRQLPDSGTILAKISNSQAVSVGKRVASDTAYVTKRLLRSTGKAAWITGTTLLILMVPLIIEMDREQQFTELELQQQSLLGPPPVTGPQK